MEVVKVEVSIGKETHEFSAGVTGLIRETRKALADGYKPGDDIPAILLAAVEHFIPAVQGIEKIPDEIEADKVAFIKALGLMSGDLYDAVTKKFT